MKISISYPPNFELIKKVFPIVIDQKGILYAYDMTIHNPDAVEVPHQLVAHEEVHSRQQDGKPDVWWGRYLESSLFRFEQELEAHREEYRVFYTGSNLRNERRMYLMNCAKRLSGPLYGRCVTRDKALRLIKET